MGVRVFFEGFLAFFFPFLIIFRYNSPFYLSLVTLKGIYFAHKLCFPCGKPQYLKAKLLELLGQAGLPQALGLVVS